jgi:hypothetical protein
VQAESLELESERILVMLPAFSKRWNLESTMDQFSHATCGQLCLVDDTALTTEETQASSRSATRRRTKADSDQLISRASFRAGKAFDVIHEIDHVGPHYYNCRRLLDCVADHVRK